MITTQAPPAALSALQLEWLLVRSGEYWRLLTCFFVHSNLSHTAMNMAGLLLITWHWRQSLNWKTYLGALISGAAAVNLGYALLYPPSTQYFGFSSLLYALLAFLCLSNMPQRKWPNIIILSAASFEALRPIWMDNAGQSSQAIIGARIATESHLFAFLGGLAAGGICALNKYLKKPSHALQ